LEQRIVDAVNMQLMMKGLQPVDSNADLAVAVNVAAYGASRCAAILEVLSNGNVVRRRTPAEGRDELFSVNTSGY